MPRGSLAVAFITLCALAGPASAAEVLFQSTLDGPGSVTAPLFGDGSGALIATSPANDFAPAMNGSGLRFDVTQEGLYVPQTGAAQNIELDKGTIEFWYQPFYTPGDGNKYAICGTGPWGSAGSLHFGKHNDSNGNDLYLHSFDASAAMHINNVLFTDYSWSAFDWIKIRLTWDWTVPAGTQNVHLYFDDAEVPVTGDGGLSPATTGPMSTGPESPSAAFYLGARSPTATSNIIGSGLYDDVVVIDEPLPPDAGAGGGGSGGGSSTATAGATSSSSGGPASTGAGAGTSSGSGSGSGSASSGSGSGGAPSGDDDAVDADGSSGCSAAGGPGSSSLGAAALLVFASLLRYRSGSTAPISRIRR